MEHHFSIYYYALKLGNISILEQSFTIKQTWQFTIYTNVHRRCGRDEQEVNTEWILKIQEMDRGIFKEPASCQDCFFKTVAYEWMKLVPHKHFM